MLCRMASRSHDYVCTGGGARLTEAIVAFCLCAVPGGITAAALTSVPRYAVAALAVVGSALASDVRFGWRSVRTGSGCAFVTTSGLGSSRGWR
jgi:hypothetical protein